MLGQFGNVGYSIDGGVVTSIRNLPITETRPDPQSGEWYYYTETASASLDLPQLSDGAHNVTVYYGWQYLGVPQNPSLQRFEVYAYQTVNFTIGTPQPTPSPNSTSTPTPTPTPSPPNFGPTSSPTPAPSIPEFSSWTIPLLLTIMLTTAGLLFYLKNKKQ
jgi:hypothetical protein